MASVGLSRRRNAAYTAALAAKQRRQKIMVGVGLVLMAAILAYEVPHTLKLVSGPGSGSTPSEPAAVTVPTAPPPAVRKATRRSQAALGRRLAVDPFSGRVSTPGQRSYGDESVPAGMHDPFAPAGSSAAAAPSTPPPSPTPSPQPLPSKIVIGTPGAGRVAVHGWIVILASIPTAQGRTSAVTFAKRARGSGLTSVAVLNSSNRRPLRGGYWVVYSGPFQTLGAVSKQAVHVHSLGYGTAYIRELIVYK